MNGNQVGTSGTPIDPLLGALADNGGPTQTHALLVGSSAINAGANTGAPASDQRGTSRDGTADIGAYELRFALRKTLSRLSMQTTAEPARFDRPSSTRTQVRGHDLIDFNIAGTGAHTINLLSVLPNITDEVTIDAATDDSFAANGNAPAIIVDGNGLVGSGFIFEYLADSSLIQGLVIRDFAGNGITLYAGADDITIHGNYIGGLDENGNNGGYGERITGYGIYVGGANATIGGTTDATRNVISGNYAGIVIDGGAATGATVIGNVIGMNAAGDSLIGNQANGVVISNGSTGNTIGGPGAGEGNVVVASGYSTPTAGAGVSIQGTSSTGNTIRGNTIYGNAGLGIDLSASTDDGVTANDAGDGDSGGNSLQNWGVLTSASIADNGTFSFELDYQHATETVPTTSTSTPAPTATEDKSKGPATWEPGPASPTALPRSIHFPGSH